MKIAFSRVYLPAALWGGVCVGLALVIGGLELDWGRQLHAPLPAPRKSADKPAETLLLPEFVLPPLEQGYPETVNRPLFVVTRRPAPPPPPPTLPKPAMQKGQFTLLGVIITKDISIALLKEKASGKTHRVIKGKEINGITLEKVEAEKVTLTQGDDNEEIILKIHAMPRPASTSATTQPGQLAPGSASAADSTGADRVSAMNRQRAARGLPPVQ